MKLYEFVDRLYAMGDMESPKTIRSKKTLNESVSSREDDLDEDLKEAIYDRSFDASDKAFLRKNGYRKIEKDCYRRDFDDLGISFVIYRTPQTRQLGLGAALPGDERWTSFRQGVYSSVYDVFQTIEYIISHQDRLQNILDDLENLNEGILGGLAGVAIGGLAGNSLGHPILGAIGGGLAGSAIQNALNDDLDESYGYEPDIIDDICTTYRLSTMTLDDIFEDALKRYGDEGLADEIVSRVAAARGLNEDKDLSTVSGSMTQILQDNREKIDACGSAKEVHDTVAGLLAEAGLDTQATRRLLLTLKKQKGLTGALQAVYNSILKGSDLGVIKEAANANPPRYQVKGCGKNGRVENHDQFMIFDSEYNDEIDYYDLCEIIRDVNEDNDLSSSQVEDIATDVISELYFQTPDEDLGEIISMYSY